MTALSVGDEADPYVVEDVDREDFVRYLGASGDIARHHYSDPDAVDAGYPSVFAPGMLTAGYAASMLTDWVGVERLRRFRTRLQGQVWPGDTLTVEGVVTAVDEDVGTAEVDIEVTNQAGTTVLTGDATVALAGSEE